ncbi:hypothetical protein ACLOJK_023882 [Asimina triloba]
MQNPSRQAEPICITHHHGCLFITSTPKLHSSPHSSDDPTKNSQIWPSITPISFRHSTISSTFFHGDGRRHPAASCLPETAGPQASTRLQPPILPAPSRPRLHHHVQSRRPAPLPKSPNPSQHRPRSSQIWPSTHPAILHAPAMTQHHLQLHRRTQAKPSVLPSKWMIAHHTLSRPARRLPSTHQRRRLTFTRSQHSHPARIQQPICHD